MWAALFCGLESRSKEEEVSRAPAFLPLCFLTVAIMWPTTTCSRGHNSRVMVDRILWNCEPERIYFPKLLCWHLMPMSSVTNT